MFVAIVQEESKLDSLKDADANSQSQKSSKNSAINLNTKSTGSTKMSSCVKENDADSRSRKMVRINTSDSLGANTCTNVDNEMDAIVDESRD